MKVIDLLNKIANGEEVPKYIEYRNWNNNSIEKMLVCKENIFYKLDQLEIYLNDEVEIIEEDKKIENAKLLFFEETGEAITQPRIEKYNDNNFKELKRVTDELIEEIEKLKESK